MRFFRRPFVYAGFFTIGLIAFTAFALLDTFLIPHAIARIDEETASAVSSDSATSSLPAETQASQEQAQTTVSTAATAVISDSSYEDDAVSITLRTLRLYDTTVYLADIQLRTASSLRTALAHNTYGTNITDKTSAIAADNQAILAINGDYYGANSRGYVIKNGVLYRDSVRDDSENGDLVVYSDGSFGVVYEGEASAQALIDSGVQQLFAFGPVLLEDGTITVSENDEVGKAMASNPRTAIGIVSPLHYLFVVSDGRTEESEGLTLLQLAQIMQDEGCTLAYNLDGGGSSTLYFNGRVINNPTTNGRSIRERAVSDIVYVGIA